MANFMYDKARELFASPWLSSTVKMQLIDTANYTPSSSAHQYLSDVPLAARIGSPQTLSGKSATAGVCDASDPTFAAITGPTIESFVIYFDTGVEATSPLIAYWDACEGLPLTPNGGNITFTLDNGANKLFRI